MGRENILSNKKSAILLFFAATCFFYLQAFQAPQKAIFEAAEKGEKIFRRLVTGISKP